MSPPPHPHLLHYYLSSFPLLSIFFFFFLFLLIFLLFLIIIIIINYIYVFHPPSSSSSSPCSKNNKINNNIPISYPILGCIFQIWKNRETRVQWIADILISTPTLTFTLHRPLGYNQIFTANAANVHHILKSHFSNYPKGDVLHRTLRDFLGNGIFNTDGHNWKFQRQLASHHFNTTSLRKFVRTVVDSELTHRLIPILARAAAAANNSVLDLQDLLQRFAFDNICKIAFGYDPAYLLPSLPDAEFASVFARSLKLISERFNSNIPFLWKIKRALRLGKERQLKILTQRIRDFARAVIQQKKQELKQNSRLQSEDLLSRFLQSGHSDENLITDVVISFILAGRDTTSAALTWFFWVIQNHPTVEAEIIQEINEISEEPIYEEVKNMVYTHATLCETMRLYPPVPVSTKYAANDDVLPDGTVVKKGTRISYHPYAMGRAEEIWGPDWAEFRPERWLERGEGGKWKLKGKDPFSYPVFQAGPRVCLGKEMAFLQMKRVAAGVLRRFKVVSSSSSAQGRGDWEPVYISDLTAKMKGGYPVRIKKRN